MESIKKVKKQKTIWELLCPKQKVKLIALIIIFCAGTWGVTTFCFLFPPMYHEANWAYQEAIKLKTERLDKANEGSVKAAPHEQPKSEGESKETSFAPVGQIAEILPKIHQLESSGGKNDSCKRQGKVNGYGFMISKFHHRCYETKQEVEKDVAKWFEEKLKTKTLAESLCGYNLGFQSPNLQDCINQSPEYPYYKNYLALN